MKRLFSILIAVLMLLGISSLAIAADELKLTLNSKVIYVDGVKKSLDVPAVATNGVTMVPMRFVAENLNCTVDYFASTKTVIVKQADKNVNLTINSKVATVNGAKVNLLMPATIKDSRTLVPLRFLSEQMGMKVDYNSTTKGIIIKSGSAAKVFNASFDMPAKAYIGEKVTYNNTSVSPYGAEIISATWTGNQSYFSQEGTYQVSLKVKDSMGHISNEVTKPIIVTIPDGPCGKFKLSSEGNNILGGNKFYAGEIITYQDLSSDSNGINITSSQWQNKYDTFDKIGSYIVGQRVTNANGKVSPWYYQEIEVVPAPNKAPIAKFSMPKTIDQGVTVDYVTDCSDPDGDEIIAYDWTGKEAAFWGEGQKEVTLKVKDKHGAWSEPYTQTIYVTSKVVKTRLQYFCDNALAGQTINVTDYKVLDFDLIQPTNFKEDNTPLLMSNSPETVKQNGILYEDTVNKGLFRLLYSHKNGTTDRKRVYVLAQNVSDDLIMVSKMKSGHSGPSTDEMNTGKTGLMRYLASDTMIQRSIQPGERIVIDGPTAGFGNNEMVYGIMDYHSTGAVKISFVVVDEKADPLVQYSTLSVIDRDQHIRGTFDGANRTYFVNMDKSTNSRFIIGSAQDQKVGIDATTGLESINKGNYGVIYKYEIMTRKKIAILTNPRGGNFLGAGLLPDGTSYGIPEKGLIKDGSLAAMHMILQAFNKTEYVFMPPASSNLPVAILMMPVQ